MTITVDALVAAFPEFGNASVYPSGTVAFWVGEANTFINPSVFGAQTDLAAMLWAAHNIVVATKNAQAVAAGGVSGGGSGLVSGKSVGKVSVSYDTGAAASQGAGIYNTTSYGQQFWRLVAAKGTGGFYARGTNYNPARVPYIGFGFLR